MATGAVEPLCVDTNTIVFASELRSPLHDVALQTLTEAYSQGAQLWTSRQIIREYLAVLTRPQIWGLPSPIATLIDDARRLERTFRVAEDRPEVTATLLELLRQFPTGGRQVHDANIVATMLTYGIPRLLTDNVADFARFAGVITVVPLVPAPPR